MRIHNHTQSEFEESHWDNLRRIMIPLWPMWIKNNTSRVMLKNHVETTHKESWYPVTNVNKKTNTKWNWRSIYKQLMKNPDTPVNNVNIKHERSEFEESHYCLFNLLIQQPLRLLEYQVLYNEYLSICSPEDSTSSS